MTEAAVARIGESVDELCDDLDRILGRVIQPDPVLRIVREQEGLPTWMTRWTVMNTVSGEQMFPWTRDRGMVMRFGVAFAEKHPGTRLDESFGLFSTLVGEPQAVEVHPPAVSAGVHSPASPTKHSVHVDFFEGGAVVIPLHGGTA